MKRINAEFFDVFGFVGFLVLFFIGLTTRNLIGIKAWIIIIISLIGLIADGFIVINSFVLRKRKWRIFQ